MFQWSIRKKLYALCFSLLFVGFSVAGFGLYGNFMITNSLTDIANVQLPAVRAMSNIDMIHDSLRAIAYRGLYMVSQNEYESINEIGQEFAEATETLKKSMAEIEALKITEDTMQAYVAAKPSLEAYLEDGKNLVAFLEKKDLKLAQEGLAKVDARFSELEKSLEMLGEKIEKDAEVHRKDAMDRGSFLKNLILLTFGVGILFGTLLSVWIVAALVKVLNEVMTRLASSSDQVFGASNQSAQSSSELGQAATEQAASLQQTTASVEEISAMTRQNAEFAAKVKQSVELNHTASLDGTRSVTQMISSIDEIKQMNDRILGQMGESNKELEEIVKIISSIDSKTKVINDIVFQTKLLSFNASVEAARAGEHGKGFAVVAEEVGNLAQMSGNAAREITSILSESIKHVNEIVQKTTSRVDELVESSQDKISMGQSTAAACRQALEKISKNAQEVSSLVSQISEASQEQSHGIDEISKAVLQLDQVTQQNAAVAQATSSQSQQLKSEAEVLASAVKDLVVLMKGSAGEELDRAA